MQPLFSKGQVESLKPYIRETVDTALNKMIAQGCSPPVDLIENFALPVPSYVSHLFSVLGVSSKSKFLYRLYILFSEFHSKIWNT